MIIIDYNIMYIQVRENVQMRPRKIEDAPQIFEIIDKNRDNLREWLLWVDSMTTVEIVESVVKEHIEKAGHGTNVYMGIFHDNLYIGNIEVKNINRFSDSAQIGYWLAPEWQGKGIMTDCVRALTDYCFDELNLNSVHISCADKNKKSRAVPERLNFVQEGVLQDCMKYHGVFYDEVIYGVVKRNWIKYKYN